MIKDASIKAAMREIKRGKKTAITLSDDAPRGSGRLMLIVKPERAEWYAARYFNGARKLQKLGALPAMQLLDARLAFASNQGKPTGQAGTFGELCDGYVGSLRDQGKNSAIQAERLFDEAAIRVNRNKLARDVTPADIVSVVKPVFDRGARVQADKMRMFLGAAYRWGIKAAHDYRVPVARGWGITTSPVDAVPRDNDAEGVGERWLQAEELAELLKWSMPSRLKTRKAIALIALTGQRVREITQLRAEQWDGKARLLTWQKTKNGLPHTIPVCEQAAAILDTLRPNAGGWLFDNTAGPGKPMPDGSVLAALIKYARWQQMPQFTGRDLRRTWKTLAGEAGLSKLERDWLQNHTDSGVSSRHYDRWENMPAKRAAVARWEAWLKQQVRPHKPQR